MSIRGVCPVLSVPFDQSGEVDYESFANLCSWIISIGTQSVLFFGVASENIKLSDEERLKLLKILIEIREGSNLKVITTVADHSAELAVKRARLYESMGADLINILPPTFFSPTVEQVHHHLSKILNSVKVPVVIQHLPQVGGDGDVSSLVELSREFDHLAMIKCEANPPDDSIRKVEQLSAGRVKTLIGWGGIHWVSGSRAGAVGIQPGCGVTDLYLWAQEALDQGKSEEFERRLAGFIPIIAEFISTVEGLIAAEKYILASRNIIATDYCRAPTVKLSSKMKSQADELIALAEKVMSERVGG